MGNADSKVSSENNTITADIGSIRSKDSIYTDYASYDAKGAALKDGVNQNNNSNNNNNNNNRPQMIENRVDIDKLSGRNGSGSSGSNTRDDELVSLSISNQGGMTAGPSKRVSDDQIHVNMAMADLMAYLQVVANNSNNLPLTRRDDPELDRTVSSLSSEEYARKSAAFIPADVRIIGGAFTRYGRVWDLPTSEEYNACDGAQEPGRSYGGAVCNTFLKVLYDAANEMDGAAQTAAAAKSLFEDDDEEDEELTTTGKSFRSMYSIDYTNANLNVTTWSRVLSQMKSEFKEVGYSQYPKITTTRKIDLNKPFSFLPEVFDKSKNRKRSLLIGCNYHTVQGAELKASHDDIRSIKDYIVNVHGFSEAPDDMIILLDEDGYTPPTFTNIIESFKKISEESQAGDAVFVQFSGHGGRVLDSTVDSEAESYDEVIVPIDYQESGLIRDTLIFKTLLAPMRFGVTVTVMIDSCDTGMMLELPYSWTAKSDKKDIVAKLSANDDFSFVRFLKVVKTLYESSTFTQLGKTVGSALNPIATTADASQYGDDTHGKNKKNKKKGKSSKAKYNGPTSESIFEAFTDACSAGKKIEASKKSKNCASSSDKEIQRKDNFFEQMIKGCTLLATPEDDFSDDEETFKTRTEDELSFYSENEHSYETANTEDEYESRSRYRRRR